MVKYSMPDHNDGILAKGTSTNLTTLEGEEVCSVLLNELDKFLSTPRFDDDTCIILNMPELVIRRAREKVNSGIWHLYNTFHGPNVSMMTILVAIEKTMDADRINAILDDDIKVKLAEEQGVTITSEMLERAAQKSETIESRYDDYQPEDKTQQDEDNMMSELLKEIGGENV